VLRFESGLAHDDWVTATAKDGTSASWLKLSAVGGLVFVALYVVHRVLQGGGPSSADPPTVAAYNVAHRGALLGSEIALGLALLAFLVFLAPLAPVLWRAGQETIAMAMLAAGVVFVAMGLVLKFHPRTGHRSFMPRGRWADGSRCGLRMGSVV
jgi:hypothetical protein